MCLISIVRKTVISTLLYLMYFLTYSPRAAVLNLRVTTPLGVELRQSENTYIIPYCFCD